MPGCWSSTGARLSGAWRQAQSFDAAKVEKMPGVKKVMAIDGNAVVVVADTYWNARTALAALPSEWAWQLGKVQTDTITALLKDGLDASEAYVATRWATPVRDRWGRQEGDGDIRLPLPGSRHHGGR